MSSNSAFSILWRRKRLTFTLLFLTLVSATLFGAALQWVYKASITEALLNSKQSSKVLGGGNPYLSFNASMVQTANLLSVKLTSTETSSLLHQEGYLASYDAQVLSDGTSSEEPFIQISVSGGNKDNVARTVQGVSDNLSHLLQQLQSDVPLQSRLSLQTISAQSDPTRSSGSKVKSAVGLLGVGLVLTFLIPQAVEGASSRRQKTSPAESIKSENRIAVGNYARPEEHSSSVSSYRPTVPGDSYPSQAFGRSGNSGSHPQQFTPTRPQSAGTHARSPHDNGPGELPRHTGRG